MFLRGIGNCMFKQQEQTNTHRLLNKSIIKIVEIFWLMKMVEPFTTRFCFQMLLFI